MVKKLSVHNLKSDISVLLLFDGHSIKPGFKGKACFGLFLFNFLLDLIAALALQKVLSISQPNPNFQRASLMVLILLIACFVLFTGAFFSYSNFFSSNVEIFAAYTIDFSILIVMFGFGIIAITLSVLSFIDDPIVGLGSASIGLLLIFIAVKYFAAAIEKILIASHHIWQSVGRTNMIFVLSSTTIIPILTILIVLLITISIKCLSEGIREALAAHVNFVRIETGGSNIAALVVFLSFLIALFSAIIFK